MALNTVTYQANGVTVFGTPDAAVTAGTSLVSGAGVTNADPWAGGTQYEPNKVWSQIASGATARTTPAAAITNNVYTQWTVSRTGGMLPKQIRVKASRGAVGTSTRGFRIRWSVDNYATDLLGRDLALTAEESRPNLVQFPAAGDALQGDLSAAPQQTAVTFRIYNYATNANNSLEFDDLELTYDTPAAGDTTAPTVPGNVQAVANSATQVTVTWNASTDAVGVTSYRVRRNGADLAGAGAVTGTSFVDTSAVASTAYSYTVSAVDAASNRSAESTAANVTTPAGGGSGGDTTVTRRQYATGGTYGSTATLTTGASAALASPAVAGNLLVFAVAVDKTSGAFTVPAGYTELVNTSGIQSSLFVGYKIAAGGETTASITWATASRGFAPMLVEYQSAAGFASPPVGPSVSPAYVDTDLATITLGPLTATAPGLPVVIGSIDSLTGTGSVANQFVLTATGWTWVGTGGDRATSTAGGIASPTGAPGASLLERNTQVATDDVVPATAITWGGADNVVFSMFLVRANAAPAITAPTVDAGAATGTATTGSAFTRTATESDGGAAITSRAWTIVSGPTGAGTTIGTAAALSWTPSQVGTYVLRYSATNSAGTGSDDVTVTVSAPAGPTPTLLHRVIGIPDDTSVPVSARTTNATSVRAQVSTSATFASGIISGSPATPNAQGDAQMTVTGLTADTDVTPYYLRIGMTNSSGTETFSSITGPFRTAETGVPGNFSFSFASCDDAVDSAVFTTIAARDDDYFLHLGDWMHDTGASSYADGTGNGIVNLRAQLVKKLQAPNHAALYAKRPMTLSPSDHDTTINGATGTSDATGFANLNTAVREILPLGTLPASGIYKQWTKRRTRFIQIDGRTFKGGSTALGATQKQWLKDQITASAEKVIFLVQSDSSWIGTGDADQWGGFTAERTELTNFFAASGKTIVILGGDAHSLAASNNAGAANISLFQAAPLENSASQKGGPFEVGPYPSGTGAVSQYGRVVVTDNGTDITITFTGYSADNTQRVTLQRTVVTTTSVTATLSGSGSLSAGVTMSVARAAALSGSGTLSATPKMTVARTASLSGTGSLAAVSAAAVPKADAFVEPFDGSALDARWSYAWGSDPIAVSGGKASFPTTPNYSFIRVANETYDLTASTFRFALDSFPSNPDNDLTIGLTSGSTDVDSSVEIVLTTGTTDLLVIAQEKVGAAARTGLGTATIPIAQVKYFQLRESGGTVFWEHSPNGLTWTTIHSKTAPFSVAAVRPLIMWGQWGAAGNGTYVIPGINEPLGGLIPAAALSGSGSLTAGQKIAFTRAAALTSSGSLSTAQSLSTARPAALSGAGALSTTQRLGVIRPAALSGVGSLSTTQLVAFIRAAALAGSGTLSTTQRAGFIKAAALSGSGTLIGDAFGFASAVLSGAGALSTTQKFTGRQFAALSGAGSLTAAQFRVAVALAAVLAGSGKLAAVTPSVPLDASLTGVGHLSTWSLNLLRFGSITPATLRLGGTLPLAVYLGQTMVWRA